MLPLKSASGVTVRVEPSTTTLPELAEALKVNASPSTSDADKSTIYELSSSIA